MERDAGPARSSQKDRDASLSVRAPGRRWHFAARAQWRRIAAPGDESRGDPKAIFGTDIRRVEARRSVVLCCCWSTWAAVPVIARAGVRLNG
ncbi:MAG: hypothetical protein FWD68_09140 [Alphaproteobacteria bacterium]|nr:hypothetical protein [Alphaproteobacteria bacterium]